MKDFDLFPEPCDEYCPVRKTSEIIDGKWTTLIVRDLLSGKKRYSELLRSLEGVSPKMLAARLRELEARGILTREVFPTVPEKTEYSLTKLGLKLKDVDLAMDKFGRNVRGFRSQRRCTWSQGIHEFQQNRPRDQARSASFHRMEQQDQK